jgi:ankyrin repeat protein
MEDARWLNIQRGRESTTPLHDAIRLNDRELVERLLAAGADLTIRDSQWHGRPLDWANALNRPRLAALIERAMK